MYQDPVTAATPVRENSVPSGEMRVRDHALPSGRAWDLSDLPDAAC